jgi:glutaredoxin
MRIKLLTAVVLTAMCSGAGAQMYRWVDKNGGVHYTQAPPPAEAKDVRIKSLSGGGVETARFPYAIELAAKTFPVTLYVASACPGCEQARALLVKRSVPFTEIDVGDPSALDTLKALSGGAQIPFLLVGRESHTGFLESAYQILLDSAGYPASGIKLPVTALRTLKAPAPASATAAPAGAEPTGASARGEAASDAAAK